MTETNPEQKMSAPNRQTGLWREMAALLLLACLLGAIYNQASPLGIRSAAATGAGAAPAAAFGGYSNQTIAFSLELKPSTTVAPAAAPAVSNPASMPALDPAFLEMATNLPSLRWVQVKPLLQAKKIVLLDARQKERYDISHIPGALSLPTMSTLEELKAFAAAYPKNTPLVIYCASEQCHMSDQLAEALIKVCGFTNVSVMRGGYAEYLVTESQTKTSP